jgi:hypothetical protein
MRKVYQFAITGVLGLVIMLLAMGFVGQEVEVAAVMNDLQPTGEMLVENILPVKSQIFVEALGFECQTLPSFGVGMEYCTISNLTQTAHCTEIIREYHLGTFQYTTRNFDEGSEYCSNPTHSVGRIGIIRSSESGIIWHMSILSETEQVTLGNLVKALGQPAVQQFDHQIYFTWANSGVTAIAFSSTVEITNSLPIWRIAFDTRVKNTPA